MIFIRPGWGRGGFLELKLDVDRSILSGRRAERWPEPVILGISSLESRFDISVTGCNGSKASSSYRPLSPSLVRRTDVEPRQKNGCDSVGVSHTAVKIVRQGVSNYSLPWPSCPVAIQKSSIGAFSGPKGRHSLCRWCKPPDDCTCSPPSHQRSAASPPIAGGNLVKGNPIRCLTAPAKGVSALRA